MAQNPTMGQPSIWGQQKPSWKKHSKSSPSTIPVIPQSTHPITLYTGLPYPNGVENPLWG